MGREKPEDSVEGREEREDTQPRTRDTNTAKTRIATLPARPAPREAARKLEGLLPSVRKVSAHERPTRPISRGRETVAYQDKGTVLSSEKGTVVGGSGVRRPPAVEKKSDAPLEELFEDDLLIIEEAPVETTTGEVLDPYAMSGLHIVDDVAPNQEMARLLGKLPAILELEGEISRQLGEALIEALADSTLYARASVAHVLADILRGSRDPALAEAAWHLDRVAVALAPELSLAHVGMLVDAMVAGDMEAYAERLEALIEHPKALRWRSGERARESALTELAILFEFRLSRPHEHVASLTERALRHAETILAPLHAARFALSRGDADLADRAFSAWMEKASPRLRDAVALEYIAYLWLERGEGEAAARVVRELFSGAGRDVPAPYGLKMLAWEARDTALEAEITTARIAWLVAQGKRLSKSDRTLRRALKRQVSALFYRLHEIYLLRGDRSRAEKNIADAMRVYPNSLLNAQAAELLAHRSGRPEDADEALSRQAQIVREPERLAAIAYQRALIAQETRGDSESARSHLLKALEHDPGFLSAASLLGRMFLESREYEALYELWRGIASSGPAQDQRWSGDSARLRESDILENLLGDTSGALDVFVTAVDEGTIDPLVVRGLERTGYRTRRFDALVDALSRAYASFDTRDARLDAAWKLAQIHAGELDDRKRALEWCGHVLELEPRDEDALNTVLAMLAQVGRREDALRLAERLSAISVDPAEHQDWLVRLELEIDGRVPGASDGLAASIASGAWEDVVASLDSAAEATLEPREASGLWVQAALLARDRLHDAQRASSMLERALERDSVSLDALDLLEEIELEEGHARRRVDLLIHRAQLVSSPERRAELLEQAASLRFDRLGDVEGAEVLYRDAASLHPEHVPAWRGLRRCLESRRDFEGLVVLLRERLAQATSASARVKLLRELGQLERFVHNHPDAALACFEQLLDYQAHDLVALRSLAGLHASRGNHAEEATYRRMLADALEAGSASRIDARIRQLEAEIQAHGRPSLEGLRELMREAPNHPSVEHLLSMLTREEQASVAARDSVQESALMRWLQIARSQPTGELLAQARYALEQAWHGRPGFVPAQLALLSLYEQEGDWREAAHLAHHIAGQLQGGPLESKAWRGAAERWMRAGEVESAVDILEPLVAGHPEDAELFDLLRHAYEQLGDSGRLAQLYQRFRPHEEPTSGDSTDVGLRQRALAAEASGAVEDAVALWSSVLEDTQAQDKRAAIQLRVGSLLIDRAPDRALPFYQAVLDAGHRAPEAYLGLARSSEAVADMATAVTAYRRYYMLTSEASQRLWVAFRLAELHRYRLLRLEEAANWYATALDVDPTNEAARAALDELRSMGIVSRPSGVGSAQSEPENTTSETALPEWVSRVLSRVDAIQDQVELEAGLWLLLEGVAERDLLPGRWAPTRNALAQRYGRHPTGYLSRDEVYGHLCHPDARGPLGELLVHLAPELSALCFQSGAVDVSSFALAEGGSEVLATSRAVAAHLGIRHVPVRLDPLGVGVRAHFHPELSLLCAQEEAPSWEAWAAALEAIRDRKGALLEVAPDTLDVWIRSLLAQLFGELFVSGAPNDAVVKLARGLPRRKKRGLRPLAQQLASDGIDVELWQRGAHATLDRARLLFTRGERLGRMLEHSQSALAFATSPDFTVVMQRLYPEVRDV